MKVSDLAGHAYTVPVRVHDATPRLAGNGLRDMQLLTGTLRPGPSHVGDVRQDMEALWRTDLEEYQAVAAHQARLVLFYGCELQGSEG